jgi:hypothetical protein
MRTHAPPKMMALVFLALALAATPAPKIKAVSTDGEATMYVKGDFSGGFNVAYGAVLRSMPANRSATFLDVMLIGRQNPGPAVELGLTRDARNGFGALRAFTAVTTRYGARRYSEAPIACAPACVLILRGDSRSFRASVMSDDGYREIGSWDRRDFDLREPYVQLNGEVAKTGDAIYGVLAPVRVVAAARELGTPSCAFTTRGVVPSRLPGGMLTFTGANRNGAPVTFVDLTRNRTVTRCAAR